MIGTSVIITCWNYGCWLEECAESVLKQTRMPEEIFIMDDHSEDETAEVGARLAAAHTIVRYMRSDNRMGPSPHINEALGRARSGYCMVLDADDYLEPEYIEKTGAILDMEPDVGVVYTDNWAFGAATEERNGRPWYRGVRRGDMYRWEYPEFPDRGAVAERLGAGNFILGAALFRRVIYEAGARWSDADNWNDWRFWQSAVALGWMARHVAEPLLCTRQHDRNKSR